MRGLLITVICLLASMGAAAQNDMAELRIGVLAKRGTEIAYQRWNDTAAYLGEQLPGYRFRITPLSFEQIEPAIRDKKIDFLLTNSGIFVNLSFHHDLTAIATLKRKIFSEGFTRFGGVVFTRSDNREINSFSDLVGRRFAAVDIDSLGGWVMAQREFATDDIDPEEFASLSFLGTHDAVVHAVLKGEVDGGTVRTDTLERMAMEGRIDLLDIKTLRGSVVNDPLHMSEISHFPFMISTRLYPEWPFAVLGHVSNRQAEDVAAALIGMPVDAPAAVASKVIGWTIPRNYRDVELAYSELKKGVFAELAGYTFSDVFWRYWHYFLTVFFVVTVMVVATIYIVTLNRKLRKSQSQLRNMATHDALTGLPNRTYFYELGEKYLRIADRENLKMMVMFVDLDRFKLVNDTYGHDAGDFVLKEVAKRILAIVRSNDIVSRIGGDEFLLMLWNVESIEKVEQVMQRLIESISLPMLDTAGNRLQVGASIGASNYPEDDDVLEKLIKKADKVLYEVKGSGRGSYMIHQSFETSQDSS